MNRKKFLLLTSISLLLMGCSKPIIYEEEIDNVVEIVNSKVLEYLNGQPISSFKDVHYDKPNDYLLKISEENNKYDFYLSLDKEYNEPLIFNDVNNEITLTNLQVATTYYWKAIDKENENVIEDAFRTSAYAPRMMEVDGINNVRDIGGWSNGTSRIAQGLIFRGSEMNYHYVISDLGKRIMKDSMRIKVDLDLRGVNELEGIKNSPLGEDVTYINLSNFSGYGAVTTKKDQIVNYQRIFKLLADKSSYPIYIHCYQGADRTGTICAMIEGLMGVSSEDRLKDYNLTTFSSGDDAYRDGESSSFNYLFIEKNIVALYPAKTFALSMEKYLKERLALTNDEIKSIKNILSGKEKVNKADIAYLK